MALSPQARPERKSYRRQALIWLMMTLVLGVVTALVWMFSQTPAMGARIENAPISTPQVSVEELKQPLSIESLHELDTDVQPIDFEDTIRDLRNYPDEFKDKRYLLANKGKWTVQVMNVAENEVIVSYLEGRPDRDKFSYFRYRDENKQLRYMLTYGLMSSPQEAVGAAKLVDFGLPADVRVLPEEISRYVGIIDNYERPEPIKDLSTRRARSVKLQPTKREVPLRDQDTADSSDEAEDRNASRAANDGSTESIRQSSDTSATLSVTEARRLETEEGSITIPSEIQGPPRQEKTEPKKPPVVPTPTPPSSSGNSDKNKANGNTNNNSTNNSGNNNSNNSSTNASNNSARANPPNAANNSNNAASANNKPAGAGNPKNDDAIKALIEDKNN